MKVVPLIYMEGYEIYGSNVGWLIELININP